MLFTLPLARKRKVAPTGAPSLDALIPDAGCRSALWPSGCGRSFVSSFLGA